MRKLHKLLRTKGCAVCGASRSKPTPLCDVHEEDFLKSDHAKPMRVGLDYRIETIESCYLKYVQANKSTAQA